MPRSFPGKGEDGYHDMIDGPRPGTLSIETVNNDLAVEIETNIGVPLGFESLERQQNRHRLQHIDVEVTEGN